MLCLRDLRGVRSHNLRLLGYFLTVGTRPRGCILTTCLFVLDPVEIFTSCTLTAVSAYTKQLSKCFSASAFWETVQKRMQMSVAHCLDGELQQNTRALVPVESCGVWTGGVPSHLCKIDSVLELSVRDPLRSCQDKFCSCRLGNRRKKLSNTCTHPCSLDIWCFMLGGKSPQNRVKCNYKLPWHLGKWEKKIAVNLVVQYQIAAFLHGADDPSGHR